MSIARKRKTSEQNKGSKKYDLGLFTASGQVNKSLFNYLSDEDLNSLANVSTTIKTPTQAELDERIYKNLLSMALHPEVQNKTFTPEAVELYKGVKLSKTPAPMRYFPNQGKILKISAEHKSKTDQLKKLIELIESPLQTYLVDLIAGLKNDNLPETIQFLINIFPSKHRFNDVTVQLLNQLKNSLNTAFFQYLDEIPFDHDSFVEIIKTYIARGADVNYVKDSATPLSLAAQYESVEITASLLEAKANVNILTDYQYSPLLVAIKSGKKRDKVASLLVQAGAKFDENINYGMALQTAIAHDMPETVKQMLTHYKNQIDINKRIGEHTCLIHAVLHASVESVKALIEAGADISRSAFDHAKNCRDTALLESEISPQEMERYEKFKEIVALLKPARSRKFEAPQGELLPTTSFRR